MTSNLRIVALVILTLAVPQAAFAQDDPRAAATYFARAEAAEQRGAYREAIADYQRAYAAKPHPAVLFNIGNCYEQIGELSAAAAYLQRYVDDSPNATDRQQVLDRIAGLKNRPSVLTVDGKPAGARVYIDGQWRGKVPFAVTLGAGTHRVHIADGGRTSPVREVIIAYGVPITVSFDLVAARGHLTVGADIAGAQVLLDGDLVGYTPFAGEVSAGKHIVVVTHAGIEPFTKTVSIPAGGRAAVDATFHSETREAAGGSLLLDAIYGARLSGPSATRYAFALGLRGGSRHWDLALVYGAFGDAPGNALGAQLRLYATATRVRPYLRLAGLYGLGSKGGETPVALEAGAGLLWVPRVGTVSALGYFIEIDAQYQPSGLPDDSEPSSTRAVFAAGISFSL